MSRGRYRQRDIRTAVAAIEAEGYAVVFVDWCEDAETPGLLGQMAGVTDHARRKVKVRQQGISGAQTLAILRHELEHVLGAPRGTGYPDLGLSCGGRVNGFGDPVDGAS
jgi:hypothetical protein